MICESSVKVFCKDFTKIENYEKAVNDMSQTWACHHRLETHTSDGEKRLVDIARKELIALGMYFDRPAEELIFLTKVEHAKLHRKGKQHSEETKKKISEAREGKKREPFSEEWKRKLSEAHKGKHWRRKLSETREGHLVSEETRKKMSEAKKGHTTSEETRKKISEANRGKKRSAETRAKMSAARKGKKSVLESKHLSEEHKKKISEKLKGKPNLCFKGKHWKLVDGKRVWY